MKTALVTGSNRGIGLEFVRQLTNKEYFVIATCRSPEQATELQKLFQKNPHHLTIMKMDVADPQSVENIYQEIKSQIELLDLLINNAGVNLTRHEFERQPDYEVLGKPHTATFLKTFEINSIGPLLVTTRFIPLLKKSQQPIVVNITSQMGSIERKNYGGYYSYSASKAALNMITKLLSHDLRRLNITVLAVHPGWVRTDMGGTAAPLSPQDSVKGMLRLIEKVTLRDTGTFFSWDGSIIPW